MNSNYKVFSELYEMFSTAVSSELIAGEDIELVYTELIDDLDLIKHSKIVFEKVGQKSIRINLLQFQFLVFFDKNHFLSQLSLIHSNRDIGILNYRSKDYLFYDYSAIATYNKEGIISKNNFISNTFAYLRIKSLLSKNIITDYHSEANREFVIISATKGKILIGYPQIIDDFDNNINVVAFEKLLNDKLALKEFSKFFKNDLYEFLFSIEKEDRLKYLVANLDTIIESANRNYEIYLSSFSFDQIRDEYDKRKQKYFDELRSIINKVSGYSIGLPISISAASFAAFKTLDSLPTYILIIAAFIIFSFYFIFMIRHNRDDIEDIKNDYNIDFEQLLQKVFFIRNKKETESFIELRNLLNKRLNNLLLKINILFSIILLLNTSLIIILLIQIKLTLLTIITVTIILVVLFFLLFLYKPKSDD